MIVRIALDVPARTLFDYQPGIGQSAPPLGSRVLVPFGHSERLGIVMEHAVSSKLPVSKLRGISAILADLPPLPPPLLALLNQGAALGCLAPGKLVFAALPKNARRKLSKNVELPAHRELLPTQLAQYTPAIYADVFTKVAAQLAQEIKTGHHIRLIRGDAGTGKVTLALETVATCITQKKTALVLAPSIATAKRLAIRLQERLPGCIITQFHSELTAAQQLSNWCCAYAGACHVLVGTRSAVFTPLPELGLVWVADENDTLHRAKQGLSYSARDLAAVRGRLARCLVLMTAATLTVELRQAVNDKRLRMTVLPQAATVQLPKVEIVDIAERCLFGGVSMEMENALRRELGRQGLSVVLVNRRGQGSILYCSSCRHKPQCPQCTRYLAKDSTDGCICRSCDYRQPLPKHCPACGSGELTPIRPGSTRIASTLATRMPEARIVSVDSGSDRVQLAHELASGTHDIVVGTSLLVSLELHASTVIITDADTMLFNRQFRAAELLLDITSKLIAPLPATNVLVQTRFPDHHVFEALRRGSYEAFAFAELAERQQAGLPPFRRLALLRATGAEQGELAHFIGATRILVTPKLPAGVELLEPTSSTRTSNNAACMQMLLTAPNRSALSQALSAWLPLLDNTPAAKKIVWNLIVDPESW